MTRVRVCFVDTYALRPAGDARAGGIAAVEVLVLRRAAVAGSR